MYSIGEVADRMVASGRIVSGNLIDIPNDPWVDGVIDTLAEAFSLETDVVRTHLVQSLDRKRRAEQEAALDQVVIRALKAYGMGSRLPAGDGTIQGYLEATFEHMVNTRGAGDSELSRLYSGSIAVLREVVIAAYKGGQRDPAPAQCDRPTVVLTLEPDLHAWESLPQEARDAWITQVADDVAQEMHVAGVAVYPGPTKEES